MKCLLFINDPMKKVGKWPGAVAMPIIPALERLRQEDHKFKASLGCIAKPCSKTQRKNQQNKTEGEKAGCGAGRGAGRGGGDICSHPNTFQVFLQINMKK
jgi:hypothetical protein